MTLTKNQTDQVMLNSAKESDRITEDIVTEINIRNTNSIHPKDCSCEVCIKKRFNTNENENGIKDELGYYKGNSYE